MILRGALALDAHDHELHYHLATVQQRMGERHEARDSLLSAARLYSLCPKPHLALGSMLLRLAESHWAPLAVSLAAPSRPAPRWGEAPAA